MEAFFVFLAFVGFFSLVIYFINLNEKKQRQAMAAAAEQLGAAFEADGTAIEQELADFHLFNIGKNSLAKNVITSEQETVNIAFFQYQYDFPGRSEKRNIINQTVVRIRTSGLDLPHFEIRPEKLFHKIGAVVGYQDIDFDEYPEFSKLFLLRSNDEEAVRKTFNEDIIRFFEKSDLICAEGRGDTLLVYREDRQARGEQIENCIKEAMELLGLFIAASSSAA